MKRSRGEIRNPPANLPDPGQERPREAPPFVRQAKPGRGGSDVGSSQQSGNLTAAVQQVQVLPGRGWPPAGSESCVGGTARAPAKRRQRALRPCDGASKGECRRSRPGIGKGAAAPGRRKGLASGSGRGQRARHRRRDCSRNLGDPWLPLRSGTGVRVRSERAGTSSRKSERPVVPKKPGNRPARPGGGKGRSGVRNR